MQKSNIQKFREQMKRSKSYAVELIKAKYFPIAVKIAKESHKFPIYKSATGNAITSYMAYTLTPDGKYSGYDSLTGAVPPLRNKVAKGERVTLSPTYDGREKGGVYGRVELETKTSADAILKVLKNNVSIKDFLLAFRIGHPVEYEYYLGKNKKNNPEAPILTMHNSALIGFK